MQRVSVLCLVLLSATAGLAAPAGAALQKLETTDPSPLLSLGSSFYDLGTWSFHGTGFTSVPIAVSPFTQSFGNKSVFHRGVLERDTAVAALALPGVIALGALLAGGVAALLLRRQRGES